MDKMICSVGWRLVCSHGKEQRWGGHRKSDSWISFIKHLLSAYYMSWILKKTLSQLRWVPAESVLLWPHIKTFCTSQWIRDKISCHLVVNVEKSSKFIFPTLFVIITILNCLTFNYRGISVCFYFIPNLSYILRYDKKSLIQN